MPEGDPREVPTPIDFGPCQCGLPGTEMVVTFNGWIYDCCSHCARLVCDSASVR